MTTNRQIEQFIRKYIDASKTHSIWLYNSHIEYDQYYNHLAKKVKLNTIDYNDILTYLKQCDTFCYRYNENGTLIGYKNKDDCLYFQMHSAPRIFIFDLHNNRQITILHDSVKELHPKVLSTLVQSTINVTKPLAANIKQIIIQTESNMFQDNSLSGGDFYINEHGNYTITLDDYVLNPDNLDVSILEHTLLHECAHINDFHTNVSTNPYFKLNLFGNGFKTKKDFLVSAGYNYWTEFWAYTTSFDYFHKIINIPIFSVLVDMYNDIENKYTLLLSSTNKKEQTAHMDNIFQKTDKLVYMFATHQAGLSYNLDKDFLQKIKDIPKCEKEYGLVYNIYMSILSTLYEIIESNNQEMFYNNMLKLGKTLYSTIYDVFDIKIKKNKDFYYAAMQYTKE